MYNRSISSFVLKAASTTLKMTGSNGHAVRGTTSWAASKKSHKLADGGADKLDVWSIFT